MMPIPSPIRTGYYPERERHCKEALRGRFMKLKDGNFTDIAALQAEAYLSGWTPAEVQRAIDALVPMRHKTSQPALHLVSGRNRA